MDKGSHEIEVSFGSELRYLELIQEISDSVTRMVGFDEDSRFRIGVSVREAVVNAIQHGNGADETKKVEVRFAMAPDGLVISVHDEGRGFEMVDLPDPRDADNLLKSSGRGIFYMRSFMDDVEYKALPEHGFEVKMHKKLNHTKQGDQHNEN